MGYTRGIVVEYQYQGAGIAIVLVVVNKHLYQTNTKVLRAMQQLETNK